MSFPLKNNKNKTKTQPRGRKRVKRGREDRRKGVDRFMETPPIGRVEIMAPLQLYDIYIIL